MQNVSKSAYQAEVLLRKIQLHTVGTRYPFKDQIVLTAENTMRHSDGDLFTYTHRIDVVVKCENRIEAIKLNQALKDYFSKDLMLPLNVGVFQKPFTKDNQKARKYFSYANVTAKELLEALPKLEKDKSLKYVLGASPVESNLLTNGFDLDYSLTDYTFEHTFFTLEDAKEMDIKLTKPIYKLTLYTSSIIQIDEDSLQEELINFEINGESESEVIALAKRLSELQKNGIAFTCKGAFPRQERDFYRVTLSKSVGELLTSLSVDKAPKIA